MPYNERGEIVRGPNRDTPQPPGGSGGWRLPLAGVGGVMAVCVVLAACSFLLYNWPRPSVSTNNTSVDTTTGSNDDTTSNEESGSNSAATESVQAIAAEPQPTRRPTATDRPVATRRPLATREIYSPLSQCAGSRLKVGDRVMVSFDGGHNALRSEPDTHPSNNIDGYAEPGEFLEVVDGPACSFGWVMWYVHLEDTSLWGWTPETDGSEFWLQQVAEQ